MSTIFTKLALTVAGTVIVAGLGLSAPAQASPVPIHTASASIGSHPRTTLVPTARNDARSPADTVAVRAGVPLSAAALRPTLGPLTPIIWMIVAWVLRVGLPLAIAWAGNYWRNQQIHAGVCYTLRNMGSPWGWSWYCRGY